VCGSLQETFNDDLREAGRIPRTVDCELTRDLGMALCYTTSTINRACNDAEPSAAAKNVIMLLDDNVDSYIVSLLAVWYSRQQACIQWKNTISSPINIGCGTRQGGILSPYFFTRYIRELICTIVQSNIGCNIGGVCYSLLAYADDIVLLAPSWHAMCCNSPIRNLLSLQLLAN